ncbi:hypothetical protein EDD86DRAFT_275649 [Gorgonomyces haynaldii]|nr:hypothetical protein EDD86DRAFT_275649 [Gorgonomyces haynaldii]
MEFFPDQMRSLVFLSMQSVLQQYPLPITLSRLTKSGRSQEMCLKIMEILKKHNNLEMATLDSDFYLPSQAQTSPTRTPKPQRVRTPSRFSPYTPQKQFKSPLVNRNKLDSPKQQNDPVSQEPPDNLIYARKMLEQLRELKTKIELYKKYQENDEASRVNALIDKWKRVSQNILEELSLAVQVDGKRPTKQQICATMGIDVQFVGKYDQELDEFE